tara:strand:- start:274 stop:678 length:405 start_codon:yes stop_codon:yes gene_type:complete
VKILLYTIIFWSTQVVSHSKENASHAPHAHSADAKLVDGKLENLNSDRFDRFISDLKGHKVAVVSVKGMVCDFCARGIQKTFNKRDKIKKVDVDLNKGKVLLAFTSSATIDFEEIKKIIQSNGQTAVDMEIINI